jgi:lysophospholipase L1-like esterase
LTVRHRWFSLGSRSRAAVVLALAGAATGLLKAQSKTDSAETWVATWATAQDMAPTKPDRPVISPNVKRPDFRSMRGPRPSQVVPTVAANQSVRMVVRTTIGGNRLRIELSNAFGKSAVVFGSAHVALRAASSSILAKSDRQLTFGGSKSIELQPGVVIVSDPVSLDIQPMSDLAISLLVTKVEGPPTVHTVGLHTSYISDGDTTGSESLANSITTTAYLWLRSIDVAAAPKDFAIACLGDSITDGFGTTSDADQMWPTLLAKRLGEKRNGPRISVLNEGISGNEVLRDGAGVSALARLDRDVLSEPGVRWIVLLDGINDINLHGQVTGPDALVADDLIRGYKEIIARAHLHNIKVMGATLTPEDGVWLAGPVGEATRESVNQWIRTSGAFDALVDFDAAVRDRDQPTRIRSDFNPGDSIHPNDQGNAAMADAFDLAVFTK